jgi:hypothetical protein
MFRILVKMVVVVCLAVLVVGCGGDGDTGEETASSKSYRPEPKGESLGSQIPEAIEPLEIIEGVELVPYFDEAGTVSEDAVAPGELFTFYVFVGSPEPYHISALEYRLELPVGVRIVGGTKFDDKALTAGNALDDFSMAFQCRPPGKFYVMKYECIAEDSFTGGAINITPGVRTSGKTFLGVVACSPEIMRLPGAGGSLLLSRK